ncbi:MAG: hypothetical protein CM15mV3_3180 [Caudoviricetes sp.]|nr:MAG: hypothetical protein CM15mV3_3180 [Caudoviricetes sp.]
MEHVDKLLKQAIAAGLALGMAHGALANEDKITKGFYSMDAMGCMLLKECTNGVERINSSIDLMNAYPDANWDYVKDEFDQIMIAFKKIGVHVHLADEKYFPYSHRGVYHTVSNHFYLNKAYMYQPHVLMSVVRHEGWHAAQDCMAGTIKNSMIAIIKPEDEVPPIWQEMVKRTILRSTTMGSGATWAGKTENMTMESTRIVRSWYNVDRL